MLQIDTGTVSRCKLKLKGAFVALQVELNVTSPHEILPLCLFHGTKRSQTRIFRQCISDPTGRLHTSVLGLR